VIDFNTILKLSNKIEMTDDGETKDKAAGGLDDDDVWGDVDDVSFLFQYL